MITSKLQGIIDDITQFSEEEYKLLEPYLERVTLKRNQILLEEGQLCTSLFLVENGILRNYYNLKFRK
jgi:CRP-like cAMP-binding protein